MPRPFAVIGITFFLTLTVLSRVSESITAGILIVSLLLLIPVLSVKRLRDSAVFPSACISIVLAACLFLAANVFIYKPSISLSGSTVPFTGVIIEKPQRENDRYYYLIKTEKVSNKNMKVKIRFSSKTALDAQVYNQITANAVIYTLGDNNEDSLRYYKSTGVFLGAYVLNDEVKITDCNHKPFMYYISQLKLRLTESILMVLPNENGGLIVALLFGNKSFLSEETISNFQKIGISHITAVSGLHLSVLLLVCLNVFDRFRLSKRNSYSFAVIFVVLFMALAGFSYSVLRAGLMLLVMLAGKLINREADSINSIGFAILLITLTNPFAAGYIGLQLSFFATLGIVSTQKKLMVPCNKLFSGMNDSNVKKTLHSIVDTVMITVAATVFILPVSLIYFGRLSLIAVLSNLLLVFGATTTMILGGIAAVCFAIPGAKIIAYPFSYAAGLLAKSIIKGSALLAKIPFAYINIDKKFIYIWLACSLITFALALILYKKSNKEYLCLTLVLCLLTLAVAVISNALYNQNIVEITVIDAGNASASIITNKQKAAIIGCGGDKFTSNRIIRSLQENDTDTLDYLLIPRTTDTESKAAYDVTSEYNPLVTIVPELNSELDFLRKSDSLTITQQATSALWERASVDYYYNENISCAYANISSLNILFIFYPGCDVSLIPQNWKKADILICRSKTPNDLDLTGFKTIIVSTDKPMLSYVGEFDKRSNCPVILTAGQGNVIIKIKKNSSFSIRRGS